jgi:hypothetical protein
MPESETDRPTRILSLSTPEAPIAPPVELSAEDDRPEEPAEQPFGVPPSAA